jgi:hydroxymethylpyrimidine pyrophosphatase-like HAD family hydrolase
MHNNRIEIINGKCSKLNAINKIIELEELKDHPIYTIGDGYSDIEMTLKYNGSCVDNAVEELKKVSEKVYNNYNEFLNEIIDE